MTYSISMGFDEITGEKIKQDMIELCKKNINPCILDYKVPPHITLSIFEYGPGSIDTLKKVVDSCGIFIKSGKIHFSSIGIFHPPVLYYAPVVTNQLKSINEKVYNLLKKINAVFNPYYVPDNWVPHVSLGYNMTHKDLLVAFEYIDGVFNAFDGQYTKLILSKYDPYSEIYVLDLKSN